MVKKRNIYGIVFIFIILLSFGLVEAYRNDWGKHYSKEGHRAMFEKYEGMNYQSMHKKCGEMESEGCWKNHWMNSLDEESKEKLAEIKVAMEEGDMERVKELKAELGLEFGHMKKSGNNFHGDCPFKK
jgi:hypothetical protein